MGCEPGIFSGRPCDWPGCAASANPFVPTARPLSRSRRPRPRGDAPGRPPGATGKPRRAGQPIGHALDQSQRGRRGAQGRIQKRRQQRRRDLMTEIGEQRCRPDPTGAGRHPPLGLSLLYLGDVHAWHATEPPEIKRSAPTGGHHRLDDTEQRRSCRHLTRIHGTSAGAGVPKTRRPRARLGRPPRAPTDHARGIPVVPAATSADRCAPLVTESPGRVGLVVATRSCPVVEQL
jgi:hypothetical protein